MSSITIPSRPAQVSSQVIANRLLEDGLRKSSALVAADLLASAADQVLDLQPGSFTELAEALHVYRQTRTEQRSLTPLASAIKHLTVSEHPVQL